MLDSRHDSSDDEVAYLGQSSKDLGRPSRVQGGKGSLEATRDHDAMRIE